MNDNTKDDNSTNEEKLLNDDVVKEDEVNPLLSNPAYKRIADSSWNDIRTYASDIGVNIFGCARDVVNQKVYDQEKLNLAKVSNTPSDTTELDFSNSGVELTVEQKFTRLVRVMVTNKNPNETSLKAVPVTISNTVSQQPTRIVEFNKITHIPAVMATFLRNEKYAYSEPIRNDIGTIIRMKTKQLPHYDVTILPPLTPQELSELAKEQKATGRLEPLDE